MRTIPFVHPLSRKITATDIEALPLNKRLHSLLALLLSLYPEDDCQGISIAQTELAKQMDVSRSTISRALQALVNAGYLLCFDVYAQGGMQMASRYFLLESILDDRLIAHYRHIAPRASQLRGKHFKEAIPTLMADRTSKKILGYYIPSNANPWPAKEWRPLEYEEELAASNSVRDTVQLIKRLQYIQEGIDYVRQDWGTFEERARLRRVSLPHINANAQTILDSEALLATTTWISHNLLSRQEELRQEAKALTAAGRKNWGHRIATDIPPDLHCRVPILASSSEGSG